MSEEEATESAVKDPLVIASGAFIVGAFNGPPAYPLLTALLAIALAAGAIVLRRRKKTTSAAGIAGVSFLLGLLAVALRLPDPAVLLDRAPTAQTIALEGTIAEVPDKNAYGETVIVELSAIATSTHVALEPIQGRVRLTLIGEHDRPIAERIGYGARIAARAKLQEPEAKLVPAFRARGLAVRRGVVLTGGAELSDVTVLEEASSMRAAIAQRIGDPTLAAIALSERSLADPARELELVRGGESYLFALAGAAMAAMVLGLFALSMRFVRARFAAIPALLVLIALVLIHGATPSSLRVGATLLVVLAWSAIVDRLEVRRALPLSVIVVLGLDPASLGDTFYQLGVASLTACVTVYPAFAEALARGRFARARPLIFLLAVAFATAPLITRQFDRITLVSLFANTVAVPVAVTIAAPFSLLGGVLHLGAPVSIARGAMRVLEALRSPPSAALATPTVLECTLFYTAMLSFAVRPSTRRTRGVAVLALFGLLFAGVVSRTAEHASIGVLPGGFVVVEDPEKGVLAFGTGELTCDPEAGTRILDLYLKKRRITDLALLELPRKSVEVDAISRQRDVREVRYAPDPLEEVRARLRPSIDIEPGFVVRTDHDVLSSWKDGLITVRKKDGTLVAEPYIKRAP